MRDDEKKPEAAASIAPKAAWKWGDGMESSPEIVAKYDALKKGGPVRGVASIPVETLESPPSNGM